MPKLKTNRSAAKRFKVTKSGLVKHKKAYLRHLRQAGVLTPVESKKMRALVPFL